MVRKQNRVKIILIEAAPPIRLRRREASINQNIFRAFIKQRRVGDVGVECFARAEDG